MNDLFLPGSIEDKTTLSQWLHYLATIHHRPIDMSLDRVFAVAQRMGLQKSFKTITVTGTNGKGSTAVALNSILQHAGYHVGLYTSPHLLRYNERICINSRACSDEDIMAAFAIVETARQQTTLTFFEFSTLAALWLFQEAAIDVAVLEVGLGGRLDAVNIVDTDCAVITNVAIEHTHYLGLTREAIALEKAGIMRPQRPAVFGEYDVPATLWQHAQALDVPLAVLGRHFNYICLDHHWRFLMKNSDFNLPYPPLSGEHQLRNAGLAIAALLSMQNEMPVKPEAMASGLQNMFIPARLQRIADQPIIYVDVAHNPHAVSVLTQTLPKPPRLVRTIAVFAALDDKDIESMAMIMAPFVDIWHVSQCSVPRAASLERITAAIEGTGTRAISVFPTIGRAFAAAKCLASPADCIVVFGSFHTVAEVLQDGGV